MIADFRMNIDKVKHIIKQGEGLHVEFKKSQFELNRDIFKNWNWAQGIGNIDPDNFTQYPDNKCIAGFFKEIGWVDELGSGVRNVYKYTPIYTPGAQSLFMERDVFKTIFPLHIPKTSADESEKVTENQQKILRCIVEKLQITSKELADIVGISEVKIRVNISKLKAYLNASVPQNGAIGR